MSAKPNNFKIGLFVLIGLVLLLAALFIFGASKWFEGKTVLETYIPGDVGGLKVGAPVTLRGVPVGEVTRINFSWNIYHRVEPRYTVVVFDIGKDMSLVQPGRSFPKQLESEIAKGLRARVKSQGLAGAATLSLEYVNPQEYPPLKVPWQPQHFYIPSAPSQFSEILTALDTTMQHVKELDLQKIADLIARDLAAGEQVLHQAGQANLAGIGTQANALLEDLRTLSRQMQAFVGPTNAPPPAANLAKVSGNANEVLLQMQSTVARIDRTLANLDTSSINQAIENLRQTSLELDEAVRKMKEYPAGVLFGRPPPPARSVETPGK